MKHGLHANLVSAVELTIRDLGCVSYREAHATQISSVDKLIQDNGVNDIILVTEHYPVFTLGRQGLKTGFLLSEEEIRKRNVDIVHSERGGDITYHGPGQLVVYPLVNLKKRKLSVTEYIHLLELLMIRTSADFGVSTNRDSRNRGIWVANNKIGSVGIRVRQGVSFHGLALNVTNSLEPFKWVNPCGLSGVGMTSLQKECQKPLEFNSVKCAMIQHIKEHLL